MKITLLDDGFKMEENCVRNVHKEYETRIIISNIEEQGRG